MKRVLLTGGTGFIGRHSLSALLAANYEVHAVSLRQPPVMMSGVSWHQVDLLASRQILELITGIRPTHLLHFAWYVEPGKYWESLENVCWVQASLELLDIFAKCGGQRVVMAGTCAEYDWNYGYCSELMTPLVPNSLYGTCKHALQCMMDAIAKRTGLSAAWGRIFSVYGSHESPERLVPSVIRSLLRGEPALCTHSNQIRDFLHVQDMADAFVSLLESNVSGPVNMASGCPVALKDIVLRIAEIFNRPELIYFGAIPVRSNDPHFLVADVKRLSTEVDWHSKIDLDQGIRKSIEWWRGRNEK
jgi:nucleoside-diphosphate-sugar epimerase